MMPPAVLLRYPSRMTARLIALLLVLGLLPTGELVASALATDIADSCIAGGKGDICPGQCCPKTAHACRCHDVSCITHLEPVLDLPDRVDMTVAIARIDHDGRGSEAPPLPPPIA